MIGGIFPESKFNSSEKISNFYLPNRDEFERSIGHDFTNRLSVNRICNNEVLILAQFCEILGPMPLIIAPEDTQIEHRTIDMIVLKAMSTDYQSCGEGDILIAGGTDILDSDCIVPFFVHYFTLWDVYGRGYVRPCCIIVCCSDRLRATHLFDHGCELIRQLMGPFVSNNLLHFYREIKSNFSIISNMLQSEERGEGESVCEVDVSDDELRHLRDEYSSLLDQVGGGGCENGYCDDVRHDVVSEQLFYKSLRYNNMRRDLRSIFTIMMCTESDLVEDMRSTVEKLRKSVTPRMFSLHEYGDIEIGETLSSNSSVDVISKYNLRYFFSAVNCDRIVHVLSKFSSICCCRKSTDGHGRLSNNSDLDSSYIFPNLVSIQSSQCQYVSNICHQLTMPIVSRLLGCILQQCHLVVIVDNKHCYHLMRLLTLFQPKSDKHQYVPPKSNWPTMEDLHELPVTQVNNQTRSATMPNHLKKFVAVYDAAANKYVCGPEYNKGHITTFLELFKTLNYNQCHLDTIVNILLLSYLDLVYQWIAMLVKRKDRHWVSKYIVDTGTSAEDAVISERLALFVLQQLVIYHQADMCLGRNLFLTSGSLFQCQGVRFCAKEK